MFILLVFCSRLIISNSKYNYNCDNKSDDQNSNCKDSKHNDDDHDSGIMGHICNNINARYPWFYVTRFVDDEQNINTSNININADENKRDVLFIILHFLISANLAIVAFLSKILSLIDRVSWFWFIKDFVDLFAFTIIFYTCGIAFQIVLFWFFISLLHIRKIKCLIINFSNKQHEDISITHIDKSKNLITLNNKISDIYQLYFRYYKIHCWFTGITSLSAIFFLVATCTFVWDELIEMLFKHVEWNDVARVFFGLTFFLPYFYFLCEITSNYYQTRILWTRFVIDTQFDAFKKEAKSICEFESDYTYNKNIGSLKILLDSKKFRGNIFLRWSWCNGSSTIVFSYKGLIKALFVFIFGKIVIYFIVATTPGI